MLLNFSSLSSLFNINPPPGYKVKIKFVNPLDKTQQWSGRGGQPKWLVNGILQNKFTLEDCRVD